MVNQRTIIKWSFISLHRKENIISVLVFLIICILCVISMPVVSLSERIVLLFDGYRYARFNLFDFSRVVILRLSPIYLIGFSFSSSLSVNCAYFKLRLYRYSIWHNAINCAFALLIAIFIALQLLLASTFPFSFGQSSQEALFSVSPLVLILVIITVFMELLQQHSVSSTAIFVQVIVSFHLY